MPSIIRLLLLSNCQPRLLELYSHEIEIGKFSHSYFPGKLIITAFSLEMSTFDIIFRWLRTTHRLIVPQVG